MLIRSAGICTCSSNGILALVGRVAAAGALALGLAFGGIAALPQTALADAQENPGSEVQPQDESALAADGNVKLTKTSANTALIELTKAQTETTVSVGLNALNAEGASLEGASFEFAPEAQALPISHAIINGNSLNLVLSNGVNALSSDDDLTVGTLALPEDASKVAVTSFAYLELNGSEASLNTTASNLGELTVSPDTDNGETPSNGDDPNDPSNPNDPNDPSDPAGPKDPNEPSNPSGPNGGDPSNGGNGANNGNNGTDANSGVNGATGGLRLAQTSDEMLANAGMLLLVAGAAAFVAAVIFLMRRKRS